MRTAHVKGRRMARAASFRVIHTCGCRSAKRVRQCLFNDFDSARQLELFELAQQSELFEMPLLQFSAPAETSMIGAQAAFPPDVADLAGSKGSRGSASFKPAEHGHCQAENSRTPDAFGVGSTGSSLPSDFPVGTDGNAEGEPDAPFASLTDVDQARAASILAGGDGSTVGLRPCLEQNPLPEQPWEMLDNVSDGTPGGLPDGYRMTNQGLFF